MKTKLLVTGGTGLVGSATLPQLIAAGFDVYAVTRDASTLLAGVTPIVADLADAGWIGRAKAVVPEVDALLYMAYSTGNGAEVDAQVTCNALKHAVEGFQPQRVVFVSSVAVFGAAPKTGQYDETTPHCADHEYAKHKQDAVDFLRMSGLHATVLHATIVYSANSSRITYYRDMLRQGYFVYKHNGSGSYNIVHAEDVAAAAMLALTRKVGGAYEEYIVNGETIPFSAWIAQLEHHYGYGVEWRLPNVLAPLVRGPMRKILARFGLRSPMVIPEPKATMFEQKAVFSAQKIKRDLGFAPQYQLAQLFPPQADAVPFHQKVYRALKRRMHWWWDFGRYARAAWPYRQHAFSTGDKGTLLIVSGRGMNVSWAQIWSLLSLPLRSKGYKPVVLTTRKQRLLNAYFSLLKITPLYLDDHLIADVMPAEIRYEVATARSLEAYRVIRYKDAPVGQIGLSTYSRYVGTGLIACEKQEVKQQIDQWIQLICSNIDLAEALYAKHDVKMCFFTEVFMEEYGAFYYAALNAGLNIVRFAGTVRDNAFVMQHLTKANDRIHHASLDKQTFETLLARTDDAKMEAELSQNFKDRYSDKWYRSNRNHAGTKTMNVAEAKRILGVAEGRKVAVIYSHILYDTLFFFGTDLFKDYSEWLVETTRAAVANPHVDWLVKVHPSNIWRGEMNSLLKGKYEEERLLQRMLGELPPHVRIIGADTPINPYTWFELADYGITVRGTSGLEMAALGKTVVTGGTGRYEGNGFTIDPPTASAYLDALANLHTLPTPTPDQVRRAKRYAHGLFMLKPYTFTSFEPHVRSGCKKVVASDDLIYLPTSKEGGVTQDLLRFAEWADNLSQRDLINDEGII